MAESGQKPEKTYGKVAITLDNCILPIDKLSPTPSMIDGLDMETEIDLRILGCELIQTAGILLKLPQVAMATAQVILQRFYYSKSFVKHSMETLAMACINLASKIEEAPRRIRDVINVFHHVRQKRHNRPVVPLVLDQNYINLKNNVIKAERRVLKELGFCVHVKHPHKMIVTYLQILECEKHLKLVQTAWNYMNDSLRTDVFVRYPPETIACACIYLTARQLQISLPTRPPWYSLLGASEEELKEISLIILQVYSRPRKAYEDLDKHVEKCRVTIQEAKMRAKEQAAGGRSTVVTPNAGFSPSSRQSSPRSGAVSPHSRLKKKLKEDGAGSSAGSIGSRERNGHHRNDRSRSRSPRSRSHTPLRNSHIHSRSPSHHSSSHSNYSRSPTHSHSPHEHRSRYDSPHKHRRHDHRSRDRDHNNRSKHSSSHSRKRKRSRSHSRSRSRSKSRTPRAYKHRRSPHRERRTRRGYSRSRSKERSHKSSKRERVREDGHKSRDRHRR
ncbi:cyclin-L1-like [Saccoglossus kowalevskii]|uniref:Cyclin-L1-like n=1 Tax=Saccoglossus kowalevskii TaxID=10224 RepID=A0ABM0H0J7_SACKO|nr:PREDICTED: cyclin-L1-like [Saccoglossus kowalevskii]